MKPKISPKSLLIAIGIVVVPMLASLLVNLLTNDESIKKRFVDYGIGVPQLIIAISVLGVLFIVITYYQLRSVPENAEAVEIHFDKGIEKDVVNFVDSLTKRYKDRYLQKLDGRFEITLEVTDDDNRTAWDLIESRKESIEAQETHEAFVYICEVFEKKGRLLITGNPGVGKTFLLIKLALTILDQRVSRGLDVFPVIFNLTSWSEDYKKFEDWLTVTLVSSYGLSSSFAELLVREGRVTPLLDGLDELARNESREAAAKRRAECLNSLNRYLLRGRRAIVCSRFVEYEEMFSITGQNAPVEAQVRIQNLSKSQIDTALLYASEDREDQASANNILKLLDKDQNAVFEKTLRIPFYFNSAIEVFDQQLIETFGYPDKPKDLEKFLIQHFIKRKLEQTPNPCGFKNEKTISWLKWLAVNIEKKAQISFELSDLQPQDLHNKWSFRIVYTVVNFLSIFSAFALSYSAYIGVVVGLFILPADFFGNSVEIETNDRGVWNFSALTQGENWFSSFVLGILLAVFCGLLFAVLLGRWIEGTLFGFAFGFVFALGNSMRKIARFTRLKSPYQRLRAGFFISLIWSAIYVTAVGQITSWLVYGKGAFQLFTAILILGPLLGLLLGILNSSIFKHLLLLCMLAIEGVVPLRYRKFLDYAVELRILEKDGGHWQFRHRHIQDYLIKVGPREGS